MLHCTGAYLAWGFLPERVLQALGVTYYPSKSWALAIPSLLVMAVPVGIATYCGLNMLATAPLRSRNTIAGEV